MLLTGQESRFSTSRPLSSSSPKSEVSPFNKSPETYVRRKKAKARPYALQKLEQHFMTAERNKLRALRRTVASANELNEVLKYLKGWETTKNGLVKTFVFPNFPFTKGFIVTVLEMAQHHNHHPELHLEGTNVTITWVTHDEGNKITNVDIRFAEMTELRYQRTLQWVYKP